MKTIGKLGTLAAAASILVGCSRPSPDHSTYRIDWWTQEFSWQGMGPGKRWLSPKYNQEMVSHLQDDIAFPIIPEVVRADNNRYNNPEVVRQRSILSADDQVTLVEMTIYTAPMRTEEGVKTANLRYQVDAVAEHRRGVDGLIRNKLQTMTDSTIQANQTELGETLLEYVQETQLGGTPQFDSTGKYVGNVGGTNIDTLFGQQTLAIEFRRYAIHPTISAATTEANNTVTEGRQQFENADLEAQKRRERIPAIENLIELIGSNTDLAAFLGSQEYSAMAEELGRTNNVGAFRVWYFTSGGDMQQLQPFNPGNR